MRILFASAEVAPFAKVGGLADVAGSLPLALQARGHEVKVVMPAYQMILDRWSPQRSVDFEVRMNPYWTARATLHEVHAEGLTLWLIEGCGFFSGIGRSEEVYTPGRDAYLFFAQAALEACLATEWTPDIVHAHDWHMGFLPVLMRETRGGRWEGVASCITIHNLAYQGEFGPDTLEVAGLPKSLYNMHALETYGAVNFLKSGCVYADQVNTVSPNYAQEIQTGEYGCRLDGLMGYLYDQGRLRGILNGINVHHHNPATDPDLPVNFSVDDLSGKAASRTQLMEELGLDPDTNAPLLGVVSRLSNQKGFDLNRNWDAPNDVSKRPEILAQKTAIEAWLKEGKKIDLFLTLHNTETGEYLEGPPDSKLGKDLYEVLKERTNFDPDRDYFSRMKVEGPGRANVIQWLWGTHKVPAMLMELRVAQSKKLGKRPGTDTWSKFGAELAKQIAALLLVAK